MLALSVSISTISWPRLTASPSDTSHLRIVPSSIESDNRGMTTSLAIWLHVPEGGERRVHHVLLVREGGLLQGLRVGHRHVGAGPALHGRVEPVEGLLLDQRRQVGPYAAVRPALLHDHRAVGLLDRLEDRVQVERTERAG